VQRNDVVVNGEGLVGHIVDAGPHLAHVLLVMDPTSAVPAFLLRSHTWGIVFGSGLHARMKYIGQDVKVLEGDKVVTGLGEIYPAGIPIGAVLEVDRKDNALYQVAVLQPAVDAASLTRVLVLMSK
jgi:rod shape-determining protein MreC